MRGHSAWHYRPYSPLNAIEKRSLPYIARLAPANTSIELEWFDHGNDGPHDVCYRLRDLGDRFVRMKLEDSAVTLSPLAPDCDYEIYVARVDGTGKSDTRIARTGAVGTVVNYLHPQDECYAFSGRSLCSPSLAKLPSGALLASMDVFAGNAPQNLTLLFRSDDGGRHWRHVSELLPCFWGKLFCHKDVLYMLATTTEYGHLVIGKSRDEGKTWSAPATILPGAGRSSGQGPHKAPMPVTELKGRLYTGIDYGSWGPVGHGNALLSIDVDADLMVAENWVCTSFLPFDERWEGAATGKRRGALEGNAVVGPDGEIYNVLRYQMLESTPAYGKALVLKGDSNRPEAPLRFHSFADFNGGSNSKFDLLYDAPSDAYWAIVNEVVNEATPGQRNVLSLAVSRDMLNFSIVKRLLDFRHEDASEVGFQYISFLIDGDDILYLSRTAMNRAKNFHDANYITFHRIEGFRGFRDCTV